MKKNVQIEDVNKHLVTEVLAIQAQLSVLNYAVKRILAKVEDKSLKEITDELNGDLQKAIDKNIMRLSNSTPEGIESPNPDEE